ncbi:hypothetical protein, partial [Jeotgalibaca porci]|uniref:hypothetical protein n=1 Tax=Jeotgalibaca porci TaxID=1868793 RepID=UPI0035A02AF1
FIGIAFPADNGLQARQFHQSENKLCFEANSLSLLLYKKKPPHYITNPHYRIGKITTELLFII